MNKFILVGVVVLVIAVAAIYAALPLLSQTTNTQTMGSGGKMAVMATDPFASNGASKEYEHYNNVAAHKSQSGQSTSGSTTSSATQSGSSSGWVMLNASGTIELNSVVNSSQTIALASVQSTTYDSVRIYFDSATVTYNGQNYTATVETTTVTGDIEGGARASSSATVAVLVDLRTVVINAGSSSSAQFYIGSSARATMVPSSDVTSASIQVGARVDLGSKAWFSSFAAASARLTVTEATLSSNSLTVSAKNSGSETADIRLVIVTPLSTSVSLGVVVPASLSGSAVFTTSGGGSLQASTSTAASTIFGGSSAQIASSSSATFTYSGTITFGGILIGGTVQTGHSYLITVIGDNTAASTVVVAG